MTDYFWSMEKHMMVITNIGLVWFIIIMDNKKCKRWRKNIAKYNIYHNLVGNMDPS